jgi:hypothetical protein
MAHYKVTWVIDINADTPREAAEKCLAIQRDLFSTAGYFEVRDVDADEITCIDLEIAPNDD